MTTRRVATAGLLCLMMTVQGHALDLLEATEQALQHDAAFAEQRQLYQAEQQRVPQARSQLLPNINAMATRAWRHDRIEQTDNTIGGTDTSNTSTSSEEPLTLSPLSLTGPAPDREDDYKNDQLAVNLTQTIFDRSQWVNLKQSHSQAAEAQYDLDDRRQDLILDVADAYFAYLIAVDRQQVAEQELASVQRHQSLTKQRYDDDLGTLTDVYESRSRFELAGVDSIDAQNDQLSALYRLEKLTGHPIASLDGLKEDYVFTPIDASVSTWIEEAKQHSPSIQVAKQQLKTAQLELKKQRAGHWPTLQLRGESSLNENEFSAVSTEDSTLHHEVLLELSVPLFSGFGVRAQVKEAAYRYTAAQEALRNALLDNKRDVLTRHTNAQHAFRRLETLKRAYDDSKAALDLREQGYLEGLSSNLDLLDAFRDTFRAERDWRQARYNYLLAVLELKRFSTTITEVDINALNAHLIKPPTP